jgi:tRNA-guanine family transglycosylase
MGDLIIMCAGAGTESLPGRQVGALLFNAPIDGQSQGALRGSEKLIRLAKPEIIVVDSGGFQLLKAEKEKWEITFDEAKPLYCSKRRINIAPLHVAEVAVRLQADIMVALDFPVRKIPGRREQEKEFAKKLEFNARWAIEAAEVRESRCPEISLFIPVQCYTLDHLDIFQERIGGISFDGFSLPVRNLGLREIAIFLFRFYQMGVRHVHLLGVSTFPVIALSAYLARHFFHWVSLDSTTWRHAAQDRRYLNPHDLSGEFIGAEVIVDERIENNCPCPWCRGRTFTYIKNLPRTEKSYFLKAHNFWVTERAAKELYERAETVVSLVEALKRRSRKADKIEELSEVLSVLDACKDSGVDPIGLLDNSPIIPQAPFLGGA